MGAVSASPRGGLVPGWRPMRWLIISLIRRLCSRLKAIAYDAPFIHGPVDRLNLGEQVSLGNTLFNTRSGRITVGNRVMFGHNVMVLTGKHDYTVSGVSGHRPTLEDAKRDIVIGDGAWVASGAIILGPVRIGENAVIGAGAVVTKDVPANVLAAGNPACVIKPISIAK